MEDDFMKKIGLIFVYAIFALVLTVFISIPLGNDNIARKTADKLINTPLPEQSEIIESVYVAGKLVGSGNGMQYFGAILLKSELPLEELTDYYDKYAESEWEFLVSNQTEKEIHIIEHGNLAFKADINSDKFYIVYSWGSNDSLLANFDLRGH